MYLWNHQFSKNHPKNSIDFCLESLFRLGMLFTHLSCLENNQNKSHVPHLVYKIFQGRNLSNVFGVVFWKINDFINTFWHYLTFVSHSLICSQMATFAKYHASLILLSRPLKVETQAELDVPGPVQRLEAKATTSFSILVSWSKAAKQLLNNKAMVTQYKLYYRQVIMVA